MVHEYKKQDGKEEEHMAMVEVTVQEAAMLVVVRTVILDIVIPVVAMVW